MPGNLGEQLAGQAMPIASTTRIRDRVTTANPVDLYQFSLNDSSRLNLRFRSSGRSASMQFIYDRNQNGLADADEVLRTMPSPSQRSSSKESSSFTSELAAGTYFIRVSANGARKSNYEFRLRSQPLTETPSPTLSALSTNSNQLKRFIKQVATLTNNFRQANGLRPLKLNPKLNNAAQRHSQNMALQDFFSHTGADGSSMSDRITAAGYRWSAVAENIAAGYQTPAAVVQGWINSPGHRANLLSRNVKELGVGYYFLANDTGTQNWNHYWTQNFGARR